MVKPSADVSRIIGALIGVKEAMLAIEDSEDIEEEEASGFYWTGIKDATTTALDLLAVAEHLNAYVSPRVQREAKAFLEGNIGAAYHLKTAHGVIGPPSSGDIRLSIR